MTDVVPHDQSRAPARRAGPKAEDRGEKARAIVERIRSQFLAPLAAWQALAGVDMSEHAPSTFLSPVVLCPEQPDTEAAREAMLAEFDRRLGGQPSSAVLEAHRAPISDASRAEPSPGLNRMAAGVLIGSFPNARPHSPETYLESLIGALDEAALPPMAVAKACNTITATNTFPPSVAEVLSAAQEANKRLASPAWQIDRYQQVIEWAAEVRTWLETVPLLAVDRSNRQRPPEPRDRLRYGPETLEWR